MRAVSALSWAGIALQTGESDTPVTPSAALPLSGGESIEPQTMEDYFDAPVGRIYTHTFALRGRWWSGDLPIHLMPGAFTTDVLSLALARSGPGLQPTLFTAVVGMGGVVTKQVWNAICQTATITVDNRTPAQATITVIAKNGRYISAATEAPPLASEEMPWLSREITVVLAGSTMDAVLRSLEIRVENNPIDPGDMLRFGAYGDNPAAIIATRQDISGRLELDLADETEWLLTQNAPLIRVPLEITFTRGGITNSIYLPTVNVARPTSTAAGDSTSIETITLEFRAVYTAAVGTFVAWQ